MRSLLRRCLPIFTTACLPVCLVLGSLGTAEAGPFWHWGHPGYADSFYGPSRSFYAPQGAYGPSYYGPSSGCCGTGGCGPCQMNYAPGCGCNPCGCNPCGCDPCGCSSCVGGNCGIGCADGSCASGNCGWNATTTSDPIPDPNLNAEPVRPRTPGATTPAPGTTAPPRRTFEDDAPRYEPPTTRPNFRDDPMSPPAGGADPLGPVDPFGPATAPPSRPAPSRVPMGTDPMEDGFAPRPGPARPPGTVDPFDAPSGGFEAGRIELPGVEETEPANATPAPTLPRPRPVDAVPVDDRDAAPAGDDPTATDEQPARLQRPLSGPALDLITTTSPIAPRTRMAIRGGFTAPSVARTPLQPRSEWSAAPTDIRIVRH